MNLVRFALALCFVYSPLVGAWEPCKPFCDAGCSGAAINQWNSSITSIGNVYLANNNALEAAQNTLNNSVIQFGAEYIALTNQLNTDLRVGLSASTAKIESAVYQSAKTNEMLTDHTLSSLYQFKKDLLLSKETLKNNADLGGRAQTASGDLLVNSVSDFKTGLVKSDILRAEKTTVFQDYLDKFERGDGPRHSQILLSDDDAEIEWDKIKGLYGDTLSSEETEFLDEVITYLVESNPAKADETENADYVAAFKSSRASLIYAFSSLQAVLSLREQLIDPSFASHYFSDEVLEGGNISIQQYFSSIVDGRNESSEWYLNMKSMTKTGLLRERVYLRAEESAIMHLISGLRERSNFLLALSVASEVPLALQE